MILCVHDYGSTENTKDAKEIRGTFGQADSFFPLFCHGFLLFLVGSIFLLFSNTLIAL